MQLSYTRSWVNLDLLAELFALDEPLTSRYHVAAPASARTCAERTFSDFSTAEGFSFYLLCTGLNKIGYFGLQRLLDGTKALTGFFIAPAYRTSAVIRFFWETVTSEFNSESFICGVYSKNEPAMSFLRRKSIHSEEIKSNEGKDATLFTIRGDLN